MIITTSVIPYQLCVIALKVLLSLSCALHEFCRDRSTQLKASFSCEILNMVQQQQGVTFQLLRRFAVKIRYICSNGSNIGFHLAVLHGQVVYLNDFNT